MNSQLNNKTIIIHAPNWVGDHIMAFPFYRLTASLFPKATKVLIGRSWVSSLAPKSFSEIVVFDQGKNFSREKLAYLKNRQPELGFTLSPSFRSARWLYRIGCKKRIGYRGQLRSCLLKFPTPRGALRVPPLNRFEHRSLSYLRLLTPFFDDNQIAENYFARLGALPEVFDLPQYEIKSIFQKTGLPSSFFTRNQVLAICPGSVAPSKIYPISYLRIIINDYLKQSKTRKVILVGSQIEKPYAHEIMKDHPLRNQIVDLTTKTTLTELAWVLTKCQALIANDSGVAHLSTLTHTPLVSFIGMGRKEETIMLNPYKNVLQTHLTCSPCFKKECPRRDEPLKCLVDVSPKQVSIALEKIINSLQ